MTYRVTEVLFDRLTHGHGLTAVVETENRRLRVSRYPTDTAWIVDGVWTLGSSWPVFWNGAGSRCTALIRVTDQGLIDALEDETARRFGRRDAAADRMEREHEGRVS